MLACGLVAAGAGHAQQTGGRLSAERPDIGKLETRVEKYGEALGVVSRLRRPLGAETECNGVCYFPNSSHPVAWRCSPRSICELHCDVNPPVGGCR